MTHYILKGKTPFPIENIKEWGVWFQHQDRRVAYDKVDDRRISTVFLGLDHSFYSGGGTAAHIPVLFETMVFTKEENDPWNDWQDRYRSWDEAELGHAAVVEKIKAGGFPG